MQDIESAPIRESIQSATDGALTACSCSGQSFMLVPEAALALRVSRSYLYAGLREDRFPGHVVGDGYRLRRDFVYGFIKAPSGTKFEDYAAEWMARELEAAS